MLDFSSTDGSEDLSGEDSSEEGEDEVSFSDLGDEWEPPASTVAPGTEDDTEVSFSNLVAGLEPSASTMSPSESGGDTISFSDLDAQLDSSGSTLYDAEISVSLVAAPDLTLKAPESGFNDDYETSQIERQEVQEQSKRFLETAVAVAVDVDGTLKTAYEQTELIECQLHKNIARVDDYSAFFRENFNLKDETHTRCYDLLRIDNACEAAGEQQIEVEDWQELTGEFFNERRRRGGP